jgi:thioredoxin
MNMAALNISEQQLKQYMNEGKAVLVDYWAPWCGYCRRIAPMYDKVAQQYEGRLIVAKVNIDEEPELARRERIEVIPTLVLYKGGQAQGFIVAPESKLQIENFLKESL